MGNYKEKVNTYKHYKITGMQLVPKRSLTVYSLAALGWLQRFDLAQRRTPGWLADSPRGNFRILCMHAVYYSNPLRTPRWGCVQIIAWYTVN